MLILATPLVPAIATDVQPNMAALRAQVASWLAKDPATTLYAALMAEDPEPGVV
jgi:hypothetical protein